jgi:hypothetical protein
MNSLEKVFYVDEIDLLKNDDFLCQLSAEINQMILTNFESLVQLLYRIDVSEMKLKSILKEQPNEDAGKIIAHLIVERQMQKIILKKQPTQSSKEVSNEGEEELW